MSGVGGKGALGFPGFFEPVQGGVEGVHKGRKLGGRLGCRQPFIEVGGADTPRLERQFIERSKDLLQDQPDAGHRN
ncbi:hypothetical protein D3C71_2067350 [compost metagenome]